MSRITIAVLGCILSAAPLASQGANNTRLSNAGVARAAAMVDSVFLDRSRQQGQVAGGDWASYLLARLGTGPIPDSLGIAVAVDSSHIEVSGRLQDLPPEARSLLGPLASMVDTSTTVTAEIVYDRTGPEIARFHLRRLIVNGFPVPDFVLAPMMAQVGRHYPDLTESGRDLYLQVPVDATIALISGALELSVLAGAEGEANPPTPPRRR